MRELHHQWGEPNRQLYKTERECLRPACGVIKVSHHQGDEHWTVFWKDGAEIPSVHHGRQKTPTCEGVAGARAPTQRTTNHHHAAEEAA